MISTLHQTHKIEDIDVTVEPFFEFLKVPRTLKVPDNATIECNVHIYQYFLDGNDEQRAFSESIRSACHGQILWEKTPCEKLIIQCTLNQHVPNFTNLAKSWEEEITIHVNGYLQAYHYLERSAITDVLKHSFEQICSVAKQMGLRTYIFNETASIAIAGKKEQVDAIEKSVDQILKSSEEEFDRKKKLISDKVTLERHEYYLLERSGLIDGLKKRHGIEIRLNEKPMGVEWTGPVQNTADVRKAINSFKHGIKRIEYKQYSAECLECMNSSAVLNHLEGKFYDNKVLCYWCIGQENFLELYALNEKENSIGLDLITTEIHELCRQVPQEAAQTFVHKLWSSTKREIESGFGNLIQIKVVDDIIVIFGVKEYTKKAFTRIQSFEQDVTDYHELIKLSPPTMEYLKKYKRQNIDTVNRQCRLTSYDLRSDRVEIQGTTKAITDAKTSISDILHQIKTESHQETRKPGIAGYIRSDFGQKTLLDIGEETSCIIKIDEADINAVMSPTSDKDSPPKASKIFLFKSLQMYLLKKYRCMTLSRMIKTPKY